MVEFLRVAFDVSERHACRALRVHRSGIRYAPKADDQAALRQRIKEIAAVRVRYGYRRIHVLLRREGWPINHKRVHRLYREEDLNCVTQGGRAGTSTPCGAWAERSRAGPTSVGAWTSCRTPCSMAAD